MQLTIKFYCKIRYPLRNTWGRHFLTLHAMHRPSLLCMRIQIKRIIFCCYTFHPKKKKHFVFLEVSPKPNKDLIHLYESY